MLTLISIIIRLVLVFFIGAFAGTSIYATYPGINESAAWIASLVWLACSISSFIFIKRIKPLLIMLIVMFLSLVLCLELSFYYCIPILLFMNFREYFIRRK